MGLYACNKEKPSKVVILFSTTDSLSNVKGGDKLLFHIQSFANEDVIKNIQVTSYDTEYGAIVVFDTLLNMEKFTYDFQYTVPDYSESQMLVKLTFRVFAPDNTSSSVYTNLNVNENNPTLSAKEGNIMYSANSNNKNGFTVELMQTLYVETSDPNQIDIYDYYDTLSVSTVLTREWRSQTGVLFAKFNDFNFATARKKDVKQAFESAAKYTAVKDLAEGDIILIGKNQTALGVIQITAIFDEAGSANDRYIFSVKKIN
jgi:hypothetical protein